MAKFLSTGEAARALGVPRWRLLHWLDRGVISEPAASVPGRRLFTPEEVAKLRETLRKQGLLAKSPEGEATRPGHGRPKEEC